MSLSNLLSRARPLIEARCAAVAPLADGSTPGFVLFYSLSDGETRARVYRSSGADFARAWQAGVAQCQREAQRRKINVRWLRIDWATSIEASTWGALAPRLAGFKRNYFRHGLALDPRLEVAFLEQELNANAMLYAGSDVAQAQVNEKNFSTYAN